MNAAVPHHDLVSGNIDVVLFDVGGVLVQLSGVATILGWLGNKITAEELWGIWLRSPSVRAFETGRSDADTFALGILSELQLAIEPRRFLASFAAWPKGVYRGALELVARIPQRYRRAVLSNSNALHWPRVSDEFGLGAAFDHHFVSHLTGKIKPDADSFHHVVQTLACKPEQVLFLDDNLLNVQAAQAIGMQAVVVRGVDEAQQALIAAGILER